MTTGYLYYIKRLFSLPPHLAAKKVFNVLSTAIVSRSEKISVRMFGDDTTDDEFAEAVTGGLREALEGFRTKPNILLPEADVGQPGDVIDCYQETASIIIRAADAVCAHRFDLLGSGKVFLGDRIDWHSDFKTGYMWNPRKFYKDIEIPYGKGDIKVPWELSRFQHLPLLGQAYKLSNDEKHAKEFTEQITDWINRNPVKLGPNWACTMDVAIRAANWLVGWEFFKTSSSIKDDFTGLFLKSLLLHGRFIRAHLEYSEGLTSNHYLSDIAGLFFIAAMIPEFKESEEWLIFSKKELEAEIKKQVYDDGCDFEASTCYHRLVLELFFYPALLAERMGSGFSEKYRFRLKRMFEAIRYLIKPDGRIPQIGDNDNGRFLKFEMPDTEILDVRYLLPFAAMYFGDPRFKVLYSSEMEGSMPLYLFPVLWIFGANGLKRWHDMPSKNIVALESKGFEYAGWYVMRNKNDYMIVSCGPNGQNCNGGHAHNDKLSFELSVNGDDVIVDPGSYVYTSEPASRNEFRSTARHNTIMLDGNEQNAFSGNLLFILPDNTKAVCKKWTENESEIIFEGVHYGYQRLGNKVTHERSIKYKKRDRKYIFEDRLLGAGTSKLELFLQFSPGFWSEVFSNTEVRACNNTDRITVEYPDLLSATIYDCLYSPSYGIVNKARKVVFYGTITLPCTIPWSIKIES